MNEYQKIYGYLGIPQLAGQLAVGELKIPIITIEQPGGMYGFPPALVPLWSQLDGPTYHGYWKHWFVPRQMTIVKSYPEDDYRVVEVARSLHQLLDLILLNEVNTLGSRKDLRDFAALVGVDIDAIEAITQDSGDEPRGLLRLREVEEDPPVVCLEPSARYIGDFPHPLADPLGLDLDKYCGLELTGDAGRVLVGAANVPRWFDQSPKKELFDYLIGRGDLGSAWLTINSPGWRFEEVRDALGQLARVGSNRQFDQLVQAWSSLPHEEMGGY